MSFTFLNLRINFFLEDEEDIEKEKSEEKQIKITRIIKCKKTRKIFRGTQKTSFKHKMTNGFSHFHFFMHVGGNLR